MCIGGVRLGCENRGEIETPPVVEGGCRGHNPLHGRSTQRVSARYRSSRRATSAILPQVFDLERATALGGLNALHRFLRRYDLGGELRRRFGNAKAAWAEWPLDRVLAVLLDVAFAGLPRLYHYAELEHEPLLCALHR